MVAFQDDLAGHGASSGPQGDFSLSTFSRQLESLRRHLGIARWALVGFSLGGMIGRRYALDHPARLEGLAILNSAHDRSLKERSAVATRVEQARRAGPAATVVSSGRSLEQP